MRLNSNSKNRAKIRHLVTGAGAATATPAVLVDLVLSRIPDEVWSNPNLRILDPCCGSGSFLEAVFWKLMSGIKTVIVDEDERARYILTRMLFGFDIDPIAAGISKKFLTWKTLDGFKIELNISCANSLDLEEPMKFDIIVGNPPFQETDSSLKTGLGSKKLYQQFIEKCYQLLANDGHLAFITPTSWMTPSCLLFTQIFTQVKVKRLEFGPHIANHFPKVNSKFSYFVIQNSKPGGTTSVVCSYKNDTFTTEVDMPSMKFLPDLVSSQSLTVIKKFIDYQDKLQVLMGGGRQHSSPIAKDTKVTQKTRDAEHQFPVFHTNVQELWASVPHPHQFEKKVIWSESGHVKPFYDDGTKGLSEKAFYVLVNARREGENLLTVLNSKAVRFLLKLCKWSGFNDRTINQQYLPAVDLTRSWTDSEVAELLGLTSIEEDFIDSFLGEISGSN